MGCIRMYKDDRAFFLLCLSYTLYCVRAHISLVAADCNKIVCMSHHIAIPFNVAFFTIQIDNNCFSINITSTILVHIKNNANNA